MAYSDKQKEKETRRKYYEYYKTTQAYRDAMAKNQRNQRRKRKEAFIKRLGGKCVKCGATDSLQFDHIDPRSVYFRIGSRTTMSNKRMDEELEKCQLLCNDCHWDKTCEERGFTRRRKS